MELQTFRSFKCPLCFLRKDRLEIREPNHSVKVKVVFVSREQYSIRLHFLRFKLRVAMFILFIILSNSSQQSPSQEAQVKIFCLLWNPFVQHLLQKNPLLFFMPNQIKCISCPTLLYMSNLL